jgi:polyhydroxyalkanoate synthesis regulator phasin
MNEQQRAVVQHMVEALEQATPHLPVHTDWHFEAIEAGKALLEQPEQEHDHALEQALTRLQKRYSELEAKVGAQQQRPQNCGTGYCSCIECHFKKGTP